MESALVILSVVVGVMVLGYAVLVPVLLWEVLRHRQQLDELDQVVEAIVEANRKRT
jgi:Flp pilus assembly protein TadB